MRCTLTKIMRLRCTPVAVLVLAMCVSVTVLGIRIAVEERRVSCMKLCLAAVLLAPRWPRLKTA